MGREESRGNNKTIGRRGQVYNEGVSRYKPLLTTQPALLRLHPLQRWMRAPPSTAIILYSVEDLNFRERMCVVNRGLDQRFWEGKFMKSRLSVRREFLLRTLRNFKFPNFGRNYSRVTSRFTTLAIRLCSGFRSSFWRGNRFLKKSEDRKEETRFLRFTSLLLVDNHFSTHSFILYVLSEVHVHP